jgi:hypothetical protein
MAGQGPEGNVVGLFGGTMLGISFRGETIKRVGARHAPARASGVVDDSPRPPIRPDFTFLGVPECDRR